MRNRIVSVVTAATLLAACSPGQPEPAERNASAEAASTTALRSANAGMHAGMDIRHTGDPDTDFLQAMIPHHQGAIEMANAELAHGRDPAVRALAQRVIDAQQAEIAQMRNWLRTRNVPVGGSAGKRGEH